MLPPRVTDVTEVSISNNPMVRRFSKKTSRRRRLPRRRIFGSKKIARALRRVGRPRRLVKRVKKTRKLRRLKRKGKKGKKSKVLALATKTDMGDPVGGRTAGGQFPSPVGSTLSAYSAPIHFENLRVGVPGAYVFNFRRLMNINYQSFMDLYEKVKIQYGTMTMKRIDSGSNTYLATSDGAVLSPVNLGDKSSQVTIYFIRLLPSESTIMYQSVDAFMACPRLKRRNLPVGKTLSWRFRPSPPRHYTATTFLVRTPNVPGVSETDSTYTLHNPTKAAPLGWIDCSLLDERTANFQPAGGSAFTGIPPFMPLSARPILFMVRTSQFTLARTIGEMSPDMPAHSWAGVTMTPMQTPMITRSESVKFLVKGLKTTDSQLVGQCVPIQPYPCGPNATEEIVVAPYVTAGQVSLNATFATGDNVIMDAQVQLTSQTPETIYYP